MPHALPMLMCGVFMVYGFSTTNPRETIWYGCMILIIMRLWMWKQHPGIFLYLFLIQFIESHTAVMEANNFHLTLNEVYPGSGKQTFWMASFGLLSVMLGTHLVIHRGGRNRIPSFHYLKEQAQGINQMRLLTCIFLGHGLASLIGLVIPYGSSLAQFETYINGLPSALTIAFGIHFFLTRQRPLLVLLLFLYLLSTSFYSYFSSWRTPFILAFVCYMVSLEKIGLREIIRLSPIAIPSLALVLIWQTVKMDYREYISGGENDQAIRVTQSDALNKFAELSSNAISQNTTLDDEIVSSTYRRAGYIEYFTAAVNKVPNEIPHQRGSLLLESLNFSLIPRILNPNKGIKNDRAKVERFTDFYFGGSGNVSSFSLGHYCEAYIDWGPSGMMVQLFLFGMLGGILYRITRVRAQALNPLVSFGLIWVILVPWGTFQQDMITISGKMVWGTVCQLLIFFPIYKKLDRFIRSQ